MIEEDFGDKHEPADIDDGPFMRITYAKYAGSWEITYGTRWHLTTAPSKAAQFFARLLLGWKWTAEKEIT